MLACHGNNPRRHSYRSLGRQVRNQERTRCRRSHLCSYDYHLTHHRRSYWRQGSSAGRSGHLRVLGSECDFCEWLMASQSQVKHRTEFQPIWGIAGIAYGMVELIRRVIPADICGGHVLRLRRMGVQTVDTCRLTTRRRRARPLRGSWNIRCLRLVCGHHPLR
jgi:hypothetical protein